ncbi:glutamyl-tRNA(Gln) amidotransferase [Phlyctema vagabunda]|uniref:Glutamyl-tRNA(Gln) amidotransferase n=1 Tax=Phlyctema vagabunda TaxID=108571 RepID=A0ABR4P714_9HELO
MKFPTQIVDNVPYYVHPDPVGSIGSTVPDTNITPAIVLPFSQGLSVEAITQLTDDFAQKDDVYSIGFCRTIIFQDCNLQAQKMSDLVTMLQKEPGSHRVSVYQATDSTHLPPGPYFLCGTSIHQAWKMYADTLDAFVITVVPEQLYNPTRFAVLDAIAPDGIYKTIAVPSRLYAMPSLTLPFAGLRFALKDVYHLSGVKTTLCSRSYTELYGPEEESAEYAKKIIRLGGTIVGKTKTTSYACSDEPTDQWIDFHCPINPRGDRYQSASGSSSGAGASLAGYAWLDHSLGTDSGGSIRAPAVAHGLFGLRTSFGATSMQGVQGMAKGYDVIGFLGRSLADLETLVTNTLNDQNAVELPTKILYPTDFFPHDDAQQQAIIERFLSVLENYLGKKRVSFNIAEEWAKDPPPEANSKSLSEYTEKSAYWGLCREYYDAFEGFQKDHQTKFGNRLYGGLTAQFRWDVGEKVTDAEYKQYLHEQLVFRTWFNRKFLSPHGNTSPSAIMLMPYGAARPKYRDCPNDPPVTYPSMNFKFISPMLEAPQIVIPVGQLPYESRITQRTEYLPIAASLVGTKGSDLMLVKLAADVLNSASWPTTVGVGRFMFDATGNTQKT